MPLIIAATAKTKRLSALQYFRNLTMFNEIPLEDRCFMVFYFFLDSKSLTKQVCSKPSLLLGYPQISATSSNRTKPWTELRLWIVPSGGAGSRTKIRGHCIAS